jgi:hypothetical protein
MTAPLEVEDERALAEVRLHRAIARAHDDFADAIAAISGRAEVEETPSLRGSLQRRIVALPEMTTSRGMTSREVAAETTGDEPNCHTALKGLVGKAIVEIVPGSSPQRFRLAVKHRRDRVLRLSRLLNEGEWTTYKDFSIAVYDYWRMAITVARVASRHPAFANPHRVLQSGGTVSPDWHDEDGNHDPEECKRRLRNERAWDDNADRAKPERFVGWEELRRRLDEHESANLVLASG